MCLCGSTRFEDLFHSVAEKFTLQGNIVLTVNAWSKKGELHDPKTPEAQAVKELLDRIHKAKIDLCDRVFVINKDGYIGTSTRSEIDYALSLGKIVEFMFPQTFKISVKRG